MSQRAIWIIVILMTFSLIGIAIIQFYRINWSIDLNEKNFDHKVTIALNRVKEVLEDDDKLPETALNYYQKRNKGLLTAQVDQIKKDILGPQQENWLIKKNAFEINAIANYLNPSASLENINISKLDTYITQEIKDQGIDLKYDYGIYSNETNSFIILNGHFVATIGSETQSSNSELNVPLQNTEYRVSLFNNDLESPGYLKIFFPSKRSWLWSSVWQILLSTLIFTSLVLACFSYTIWVILRQKQVSEMKTDFINNMTHEFKTPIATISLASDSIINPNILSNQEKIKRFAGIIKEENKRMLGQVEKVLQMAKIDKKDFTLKKTDIHVHDLITNAAKNVMLRVEKRNGTLDLELNAKSDLIYADATHFTNIIYNLLDNAIKYSSEAPNIIIKTYNLESKIAIGIQDNGIGMSKDSLKYIFDKFYRVHTGNRHDVKGFGLGLSYVKAIVDAHKAQIKVNSVINEGSTFTIFFDQIGD